MGQEPGWELARIGLAALLAAAVETDDADAGLVAAQDSVLPRGAVFWIWVLFIHESGLLLAVTGMKLRSKWDSVGSCTPHITKSRPEKHMNRGLVEVEKKPASGPPFLLDGSSPLAQVHRMIRRELQGVGFSG
jgi:hypothetical protein